MILLTDVSTKLQQLLNSFNASDFEFVVKSAGYHLDSIVDKRTSRNTIPVFVSQVGGDYNPVPNLHQVNFTYEVNIYYPVRFKEDFYNLNTFLENWFVGKKVSFGSENALCNISVAEYGEIIEVEALRRFENWVMEEFEGSVHLFKKEQQVNEFYMSMQFRLFCTTLGSGFLFGNEVQYNLSMKMPTIIDGIEVETSTNVHNQFLRLSSSDVGSKFAWKYESTTVYTDTNNVNDLNENSKLYTYDWGTQVFTETTYKFLYVNYSFDETTSITYSENLVWDQSGTGCAISPMSEQLVGVDKYARNTPNITNFNKSILAYVRNNNFWNTFLYCYNKQKMDLITNLQLVKNYSFDGKVKASYTYSQVILNYNENVELGSPLSFTITFGD